MTSLQPFRATDLFEMNSINLDVLTENFYVGFYLQYLTQWPELCFKSVNMDGEATGYMIAKTEGKNMEWHTHITAVTVDPVYRRLGLASHLCTFLETQSELDPPNTYFIDLFVRATNQVAQNFYKKLGYSIFRRVVGYYGAGDEEIDVNQTNDEIDAFDMRKSLKRDVNNETVRENGEKYNILPHQTVFA